MLSLCSSLYQVVCTLVAAFLHFFFLSSFCWVLTEAWQSYMAVTGRLRNRIIRKRFLCLGWGERCLSALYLDVFNQCLLHSTIHFLRHKVGTPYVVWISKQACLRDHFFVQCLNAHGQESPERYWNAGRQLKC